MKDIQNIEKATKAMKELYDWAKENDIGYFNFGEHISIADEYGFISLTYQFNNSDEYHRIVVDK